MASIPQPDNPKQTPNAASSGAASSDAAPGPGVKKAIALLDSINKAGARARSSHGVAELDEASAVIQEKRDMAADFGAVSPNMTPDTAEVGPDWDLIDDIEEADPEAAKKYALMEVFGMVPKDQTEDENTTKKSTDIFDDCFNKSNPKSAVDILKRII